MDSSDEKAVLRCYYVEFPVGSINYKTAFSSSKDIDVKEYMQFVYPELNKLNGEAIAGIPSKVFSCVRTTIEHKYEYCYYLRYTTITPKVIIIISNEYNTFFIDLLQAMLSSKETLNAPLILQRCLLLTTKEISKSFVTLGNFQVFNSQTNYVINTIKAFGVNTFVDIVFKMLLEERFIFHCSTPEQLHPTIQAFLSVLQPFVWQHILIPILPLFLSAYLSSILPCVIGCTRGTYANFMMEFGEDDDVHVIDIDKHQEVSRCIRENYLANEEMGIFMAKLDYIVTNDQLFNDNDVIKLFKQLYELILKDRDNYFKVNDGKYEFNHELYISSNTTPFSQFLLHFSQSQMFFQFVEEESDNLNNNLPIQPIFNEEYNVNYSKLQDISSIERRCGCCLREILKTDAVYQYPDKSVYHRYCARCMICDKFSDLKKCPLCKNIQKPITKQEVISAYSKALQRQNDRTIEITQTLLANEPKDDNDLKFEFVETFQRTMKESIDKLVQLKPNQRNPPPKKEVEMTDQKPKKSGTFDRFLDSFSSKPQPQQKTSSVSGSPLPPKPSHDFHPLPPLPPKPSTMQKEYPIPPPKDDVLFKQLPLPPRRNAGSQTSVSQNEQPTPLVPPRTYTSRNESKQFTFQTKPSGDLSNSAPTLPSPRSIEAPIRNEPNKRPLPSVPTKRGNL